MSLRLIHVSLHTDFLVFFFCFANYIGKSRQLSDSGWDELPRGKASVTSKLLPVSRVLSAKEGKRLLYPRPSCCEEPY